MLDGPVGDSNPGHAVRPQVRIQAQRLERPVAAAGGAGQGGVAAPSTQLRSNTCSISAHHSPDAASGASSWSERMMTSHS